MSYSRTDSYLISEAYQLMILKESFPTMTISQTLNNLDLMTESEHEYVCGVAEQIIEEFFGGLKNILGGGQKAVAGAGNAIGQTGSNVSNSVKGAISKAGDIAKGVAGGIGAAGKQVVDNAKTMYDTGNEAAASKDFAAKAQQYVSALKDQLTKAQQGGFITYKGDIDSITLGEIIDELQLAAQARQNLAGSAQRRGFTGGAGKAFRQGFQS